MRIVVGGSNRDSAPTSPPRPTTAGKSVPLIYQHLSGTASNHSPKDSDWITKLATPITLASETSDSIGHSSYRPSGSDTADSSDSETSYKRPKTTSSSPFAFHKSENEAVSIYMPSLGSTPRKPIKQKSLASAAAQERRRKPRIATEEVKRIRLYNVNYYRRKVGKPEEPVPLPPTRLSLEDRQIQREKMQQVIDQHRDRISELVAQRDVAVKAFGNLSKTERQDPVLKQRFQRQQAEIKKELERIRKDKNRIMSTRAMARAREKKRIEQGLPFRGLGRPRTTEGTIKQMKVNQGGRNYYHSSIQGKASGRIPGAEESSDADRHGKAFSPQVKVKQPRVALGQIKWSGKRRGPRERRMDYSGMIIPTTPGPVEQVILNDRRPGLPPNSDPWTQRRRVQHRIRNLAKAGRPLELLPAMPSRPKRKITSKYGEAAY